MPAGPTHLVFNSRPHKKVALSLSLLSLEFRPLRALPLIWPVIKGGERKCCIFVWPKMIVVKMWVLRYGPIAQSFKHIGTFIPRYIIIEYHFHIWER